MTTCIQRLVKVEKLTLGYEQDGDTPHSSVEDGCSGSEGMDEHIDWDFDPAREFSNRYDGPSSDENDNRAYDITVPSYLDM